jgi:UDP-glucose 4-epimerase
MKIEGSKILVTGGAGFIGSHIVESLVKGGAEVSVYDNLSSGSMDNLGPVGKDIEFIKGDILDRGRLAAAMKGKDAVSHQAAQLEIMLCTSNPIKDLEINTIGTLNVIGTACDAGVGRLINASSACVYGQAVSVPEDESHPKNPNWAYGISKLAAEKYCSIAGRAGDIGCTNLRYAIIYGPREWYGRVLTMFIRRVLDGKAPVIFGSGNQLRDFTNVSDVVRFHDICLENDKAIGESYNVSTCVGTSVKELADIVVNASGKGLKPVYEDVKEGEKSQHMPFRVRLPAELEKMVLDNSKAMSLGWSPKTGLEDGIKDEIAWAADNPSMWKELHI